MFGIWLVNPYLALALRAPGPRLAARRPAATAASVAGTLIGIVIALVPLAAAIVHLAGRLGLGADAPWTLVLLVTGGQIGFLTAVLGCLVAGSVLGLLALAVPGTSRPSERGNPLAARNPPTTAGSR